MKSRRTTNTWKKLTAIEERFPGLAGAISSFAQVVREARKNSGRLPQVESLSKLIASIDTDTGRARVHAFLKSQPFPHYESAGNGSVVRIDENGTRTVGKFLNRKFHPAPAVARKSLGP